MTFLNSGELKSNGYPSSYPNSHHSSQSMEVDPGQKILIKFVDFSVEHHSRCGYDSVMIQDGDGTLLMAKTCGSRTPADILTRTNKAKIIFHTDGSVRYRGWKLKYGPILDCVILDSDRKNWVPGLKSLKQPRIHSSVVTTALGVYIIGGNGSPHTSEFLPAETKTTLRKHRQSKKQNEKGLLRSERSAPTTGATPASTGPLVDRPTQLFYIWIFIC